MGRGSIGVTDRHQRFVSFVTSSMCLEAAEGGEEEREDV